MNAFRASSIHRFLIVAVMMLSWFVITNHCALARMEAQLAANDETPCCHKTGKAAGDEVPCQELAHCCKSVKASLPDNAAKKVETPKFQLQFFAILRVLAADSERLDREFVYDHGPCRAVSFAETVLQRSLLSHAPPLAA